MSSDDLKQSVTVGDPNDLFTVISRAIDKSYSASGCKPPDKKNDAEVEQYNDMVNYLVFYTRKRFATMQFRDVTAAIQYGAVGEYGDFYGINTKSLVKFLTCFYNSEDHKREVNKRIILYQPMSKQPDTDEKFRVGKSLVLRAYEAFINNEPIERLGVINYDFLNTLGLITYTAAEKIEIYNQAIPAVAAARAETKQRQNGIRDLIKNFNLTPDKGTPDHAEIVSKAKGLTCLKYFGDLKLSGTSLPELLDSKKDLFLSLNK